MTLDVTTTRDPGPGEVAVHVVAAGVNPLDVATIAGRMQQIFPVEMPYTPGTDFSGIVAAVGTRVRRVRPGDRVVGRTAPQAGGAFAEYLVTAAASVCSVPEALGFEQAAALPTTFGSSHQALFNAGHLRAGQRVLIHAGAGGVGTMAIQQAHCVGAHVIATASGQNHALVKALGADEVVDYHVEDFAQLRDIDLVLDTVGGGTLEKSWSVLRPDGRIVSLVEFGIDARDGRHGEFVFFADAAPSLPQAMRMFEAGQLRVIIDSVVPLTDTRAALEKVASRHARGKVIVSVGVSN
ncbi:MAG TPA: NADP-dependent oxidoreductase [Rhodanobacteraceae bacterium]|nr:NADP-dependent oxidoreductase [Rhodanobacteraceae bacterium]